jgi:hypothetical protein
MRKLWVDGCSFCEPFGLLPTDLPGNTILPDGNRNFFGVEYWGTHLAKKLGVECVSKGLGGIGWNYIYHQVDLDILKWTKDDLIIISPSFISRVSIMEFEDVSTREELIKFYKNWSDIIEYNDLRWRTKIKTLQHFGYNVFTWAVNEVSTSAEIKNLITAPGDLVNWKDWMDLHKEYWQDPTTNKYPDGDWHFNPQGHLAVANRMYEVITKCQLQ